MFDAIRLTAAFDFYLHPRLPLDVIHHWEFILVLESSTNQALPMVDSVPLKLYTCYTLAVCGLSYLTWLGTDMLVCLYSKDNFFVEAIMPTMPCQVPMSRRHSDDLNAIQGWRTMLRCAQKFATSSARGFHIDLHVEP